MWKPVALLAFLAFAAPAGAAEFTDSVGRTVTLPEEVDRVFAAGPPASIVVFTLAPEKLLGWTRKLAPEDAALLPEAYRALPALGRLTGRGNTANIEAVVAADPDLIVDLGDVDPTYISLADRVQEQTGVPVVLMAGRLGELPKAYRDLGGILGVGARGEEQAAWIEAVLENVRSRTASIPVDQRPRVYYARGPEGLETALTGSINVETLDFVGALNVAWEAAGEGGLANVSLEQVLAWDPEIILTVDAGFAASVQSDPHWANLSAVRNGKIFLAPLGPFPWIDFPPSVNRVLGVRWVASVLYPELFPEPIEPIANEFYALFYHREPTDAELARILRPVGG